MAKRYTGDIGTDLALISKTFLSRINKPSATTPTAMYPAVKMIMLHAIPNRQEYGTQTRDNEGERYVQECVRPPRGVGDTPSVFLRRGIF